MPIKINSTGGGSVSIDVPSTGGTFTLTAPANNATIFTTAGGAITGNVGFSGAVSFASNNVTIGGQTASPYGAKNRVINGAMLIDQRNNGAAVYPTSSLVWATDRYQNYKNNTGSNVTSQQSSTVPTGFAKSLLYQVNTGAAVSSGDYCIIQHSIEGYNIADFGWGTSSAQTVTVSFWVRSSITGTYGFVVRGTSDTLNYATTYNINSSNTWEYKTITIPGPTSGSFNTTNSVGVWLLWDLGVGSTYRVASSSSWQAAGTTVLGTTGSTNLISTSGATFYITGIQLEVGPVATPFEVRSFSTELALCERYFERSYNYGTATGTAGGIDSGAMAGTGVDINDITTSVMYSVPKRAAPTITLYNSATGASGGLYDWTNGVNYIASGVGSGGTKGFSHISLAGSVTTPHGYSFHFTASAEM